MKNQQHNYETGKIGIIAAIIIVAVLFLWQVWKPSSLSNTRLGSGICRPEIGSEVIELEGQALQLQPGKIQYQLIKARQLVRRYYTSIGKSDGLNDPTTHVIETFINGVNGLPYQLNDKYVFRYLGRGGTDWEIEFGGVKKRHSIAEMLSSMGGTDSSLVYLTDKAETFIVNGDEYWLFDVYLQKDLVTKLPDYIFECQDEVANLSGIPIPLNPTIVFPSQAISVDKKQLQMQYFTVTARDNVMPPWLDPHCKPIIYLYPKQKEQVRVILNPKGFLTESIPEYPKEGWNVTVYPDSTIISDGITYHELYYESKIHDSATKIPTQGYIRKYEDLDKLYKDVLPKLGLNEKESNAFRDYWLKALPKAPYYFVGIMDEASIDFIEPLTISPKPDTIIRARVYFKALEKPIDVQEPVLQDIPLRNGFTVVEWGGMVKTDKDHPFTCSQ